MSSKRLFLVDGSALAYRSHFAYVRNPLMTSTGKPTGAVFGFIQGILRLLEKEKPDHLAVAFDTPEPTFRHKKFEAYKATREKMDDALVSQLPWIKQAVEGYRIPILEIPGYEADDLIGTIAKAAEKAGFEVLIVTGDKDFMQLVSDKVKLYNIFKRDSDEAEIVGPPEVEKKFGVSPDKVVEVLSIMGDSSDNVPGIKGIGEKGAIDLIQKYGSLENLITQVAKVDKPRLRSLVQEQTEQARLSHELVTIDIKSPVKFDPDDLVVKEPDPEKLRALFTELEFSSLLKKFSVAKKEHGQKYNIIKTPEAFEDLLEQLKKSKGFVLDTETTGIDPLRAEPVGLSFAMKEKEAFYVPVNLFPQLLEGGKKEILKKLKPILEDESIPKWGQNIKYDALLLNMQGIDVKPIAFDTMIASYCIAPAGREHNLDFLALHYLDFKKIPTTDLIGTGRNQITMDQVPIDRVGEYACEDADMTLRLKPIFEKELKGNHAQRLFTEIEMPLVPVLAAMERRGVKIDMDLLGKMSKDLGKKAEKLAQQIHEIAGEEFNINSNQQLGKILFEKLKIQEQANVKRVKKTKTGYSTDAATLENYEAVPVIQKLLEYRSYTKLKNTYLDALPELVHPKTGRVHTSFNQAVAATGRLSSTDPNLQNIPIRTEVGREIRRAFVAGEKGWSILSADYSQIELRLVAHFAQDKRLISAFKNDRDIHRETAALVFDLDPKEVTPDIRARAKAINFGIIYGMGPQRLAKETGMTLEEAKRFIETYFKTFPQVRSFLDGLLADAIKNGYVETVYGRRRAVPELESENPGIRAAAQNIAVNTPIQGSAADLIKLAMIRIHARLAKEKREAAMLLQVHDELVFEVPEKEIEQIKKLVREEMEGVSDLDVPLKVEMGVGQNWLEAH